MHMFALMPAKPAPKPAPMAITDVNVPLMPHGAIAVVGRLRTWLGQLPGWLGSQSGLGGSLSAPLVVNL